MTDFRHMSCSELHALIAEGAPTIVDIRDEHAFAAGRIQGAVHIDNQSLQSFIDSADLDAPLVVCCYHGNSSQQAAAFLHSRGFEDCYSLDGGFSVWSTAYPDKVERDGVDGAMDSREGQ